MNFRIFGLLIKMDIPVPVPDINNDGLAYHIEIEPVNKKEFYPVTTIVPR
jgi:hypothetical protein